MHRVVIYKFLLNGSERPLSHVQGDIVHQDTFFVKLRQKFRVKMKPGGRSCHGSHPRSRKRSGRSFYPTVPALLICRGEGAYVPCCWIIRSTGSLNLHQPSFYRAASQGCPTFFRQGISEAPRAGFLKSTLPADFIFFLRQEKLNRSPFVST